MCGTGNGRGSVHRGGAAPKGNSGNNGGNNSRKPNARRSGPSGSSGSSSSSSSSKSITRQLGERVEMMERQLGLQSRLSYRDVAARGLIAKGGDSSGSNADTNIPNIGSIGPRPIGRVTPGFGHAQHDPSMISTVLAAVLAVLAGGNQQQHF